MNKILKSDLLKSFPHIEHGFSTRHFNRGTQLVKGYKICFVKQIHGNNVLEIKNTDQVKEASTYEADILVSKLTGIALTIRTADCIPILFYDPMTRVIAAAHAGWRGSAKAVSAKTIRVLKESYGVDPENVRVALGPSIRGCCYEVDSQVYDAISIKKCFTALPHVSNRWMLSLQKLNEIQLAGEGIPISHIWISKECTFCQNNQFFSYRKEGKAAGRQWGFIALKE